MSKQIDLARVAAQRVVSRHPGVTLLVLFGSRARDDAQPPSDWDFAYAADQPVDALALRADLADALGTDRIDVVAIDRASALVRYRVARDGVPLFERRGDEFARFWLSAVRFWCDVAPLVRASNEAILQGLEP